jgi:hypothetical protein
MRQRHAHKAYLICCRAHALATTTPRPGRALPLTGAICIVFQLTRIVLITSSAHCRARLTTTCSTCALQHVACPLPLPPGAVTHEPACVPAALRRVHITHQITPHVCHGPSPEAPPWQAQHDRRAGAPQPSLSPTANAMITPARILCRCSTGCNSWT